MTMRRVLFVVVGLLGLATVSSANGQILESMVRDFKRVNQWPQPWICGDRQEVAAPMAIMANNGWRKQNMLTDFHFNETGELTEAGELKIYWILNEAPQARRSIFVHRAKNPEETAYRMAAVRKTSQKMVPPELIPPILETSISDVGWPGNQVDIINRKYESSMPVPRISQSGGSSGGSSGGGASSGGAPPAGGGK